MFFSGKFIELGTLGSSDDIGIVGIFPSLTEDQITFIKGYTDLGEDALDQFAWTHNQNLYSEIMLERADHPDIRKTDMVAIGRQVAQVLTHHGIRTSLSEQVYNLNDGHEKLFLPRKVD